MAGKRLQKELGDLLSSKNDYLKDLNANEQNILNWKCTILPQNSPYNKFAFKIEVNFPADYPFKPPTIKFITPIYHPNVDEKGGVCLPLVLPDNWKPAVKVEQVLQSLVALVNDPEPDHALRADLAEEFNKDRNKFNRNAEAHGKQHAEKR